MNSRLTKRRVFNAFLCVCLLVLLYRGFKPSFIQPQPNRNFLYQPTSPTQTPTESLVASSTSPDPLRPELEIVVASLAKENTTWLSTLFPSWPRNVYIVDDPSATLTVPKIKGHEAMVYLTQALSPPLPTIAPI